MNPGPPFKYNTIVAIRVFDWKRRKNMELKGVPINPTPAAAREAEKLFQCSQQWNLAKSL
jgi:hypothetical protein